MTTPRLIARGNDHGILMDLPPVSEPTVTVVIPIYNRVNLLDNVLAGLAAQKTVSRFDVIVVDDGSEEDVSVIVDGWKGTLAISLVAQDRKGRGAGRARNLGATKAVGDVLMFLDADCIPSPNYLEEHLDRHRRASNVVVTASRRHVDDQVSRDDVESFDELLRSTGVDDPSGIEPDDWRATVFRRSRDLTIGSMGFRGVLSGLMSIRRDRFDAVGGFDHRFDRWGGEDTELGWRLWNDGCVIVPSRAATVVHQRSADVGAPEARATGRSESSSLMASLVPHGFYRKHPSHLHEVPLVSWIALVDESADLPSRVRDVSAATFCDTELVVVDPAADSGVRREPVSGVGDITVVGDVAAAVGAARGRYVAFVGSGIRPNRTALERVMRRLDDERVGAVRIGYRSAAGRVLRLDDLLMTDEFAPGGIPYFGVIARRELMKDVAALSGPNWWRDALGRTRTDLIVTDLVQLPESVEATARLPRIGDLAAAGTREVLKGVKQVTVGSSGEQESTTERSGNGRIPIAYVGLHGHGNLGDDAMFAAAEQLMPWARLDADGDARGIVLGGGTLLNAGDYYRTRVDRLDGPNRERIVFGTGVRNPGYWGWTEEFERWQQFLDSCVAVGVRGPVSERSLADWGYTGDMSIVGDPALALQRPAQIDRVDGRVVLCPMHAGGALWGRDDASVLAAFDALMKRFADEGRDVVILTAHASDDRWVVDLVRGAPSSVSFVPGYSNLPGALDVLASSDLVVGERLHASVLAAAMGTRFVAIEYRPKVRDFAASLGVEKWCIRSDELDGLGALVSECLEAPIEFLGHVDGYRRALETHAAQFQSAIAGS